MSYKPLRGTVTPGAVPPIEEEEKVDHVRDSSPFPWQEHLERQQNNVIPFERKVEREYPIIDLTAKAISITPLTPEDIHIGDKVIRRIRPYEIGIVEYLGYTGNKQLQSVWVSFGNKPSYSYSLSELDKVKVH